MRRSKAADTDFLLRKIEVTPLTFNAGPRPPTRLPSDDGIAVALYRDVVRYLTEHPGSHMNDLRTYVPPLGEWPYQQARETITHMVDLGLIEIAGRVPIEQLDERYERLLACDLCGAPSADHPIVFWKHNTPVVRCTHCGLLYSNPRWKTEHLFGYYGESYLDEYRRETQGNAGPDKSRIRWQPFLDTLNPARLTNRLLDIGCATGEFMMVAKENGWEAYGVEPGAPSAEVARQATGCHVHAGTLDTAPYPDGWFDVVTLWDVIEHVQSPTAYMADVARLIRPGGLLGITTPNIQCLNYWAVGAHWSAIGPNGHIFYFSPTTLRRLVEKSGLCVTVTDTTPTAAETPPSGLVYSLRSTANRLLRAAAKPLLKRMHLGEALLMVARRE